jgi:pimeloyl-ACP methyl ester carboxylesterase
MANHKAIPATPWLRMLALISLALLNGCAVVSVKEKGATEADFARRADVLSTGRLSADASANLAIAGLLVENCQREPEPCSAVLREAVSEEAWLATTAEVRALRMQATSGRDAMQAAPEVAAHEAIDVARWAYAYLFHTARTPEQRVFELRQERVLRLYNRAVEVTAQALFKLARSRGQTPTQVQNVHNLRLGVELHGFDDERGAMPESLLASDTLGFENLRAVFRRDGFGSNLVAVFPRRVDGIAPGPALLETGKSESAVEVAVGDGIVEAVETDEVAGVAEVGLQAEADQAIEATGAQAAAMAASAIAAPRATPDNPPFRDTRFLSVTSTLGFKGETLADVLASEDVTLDVFNPYHFDQKTIAGRTVPLAANFSAAYGVWLARSELARLSLSSLLRPKQERPFAPRVYLNQPYDPDKRVVVLVHGLASSPEAWVNLANELLGESELRDHYQIWQVFYPTNMGILASRARIDEALRITFNHFDPEGTHRASREAVLVGHSMGGVISRLLVSSSGDQVMQRMLQALPPEQAETLAQEPRVRELAVFEPLPYVGRAVFLAAPHRGAELSDAWPIRLVRRAIRLPFTVLNDASDLFQRNSLDETTLQQVGFRAGRPSTGPDDLSPGSLFMQATADLPITPGLPFHTIVGVRDPAVPLAQSSDGAVPYASAWLSDAVSEKAIVPSGHSVQETPGAIMELRRILRLDMESSATP